jgi:hypothetical protein
MPKALYDLMQVNTCRTVTNTSPASHTPKPPNILREIAELVE